jgi:hypothetical protein
MPMKRTRRRKFKKVLNAIHIASKPKAHIGLCCLVSQSSIKVLADVHWCG